MNHRAAGRRRGYRGGRRGWGRSPLYVGRSGRDEHNPAGWLEGLEQRVLLSTYSVTSTADVPAADPGYAGTLRWAVAQANAAAAPASDPSVVAFAPSVFSS